MTTYDAVAALVAEEAAAAKQALSGVEDAAVEQALHAAAQLVREQRGDVLAANAEDVAAAEGRLDAGSLDRLRLDDARMESIAVPLEETAALPPLEREVRSWRLGDGLEVSERRVPVGMIGANFEARPNVAADVASQVLKSGNTVVLRTGGAALGPSRRSSTGCSGRRWSRRASRRRRSGSCARPSAPAPRRSSRSRT